MAKPPLTPLRYPGGKSRMCKKLVDLMPQGIESYYEGFLGGGSVALEVTRRYPNCKVTVNDLWFPLYAFWTVLRDNPKEMCELLVEWRAESKKGEDGRELFAMCKKNIVEMTEVTPENAASFYVVNKTGFSGIMSGYSHQAWIQNLTERSTQTPLIISEDIQDWTITNNDYSEWGDAEVIYLDPPYEIKSNLYGNRGEMHEGFSHDDFVERMEKNVGGEQKFLISYNQEMGGRFSDKWNKLYIPHTYTMVSTKKYGEQQKQRNELLLTNQ